MKKRLLPLLLSVALLLQITPSVSGGETEGAANLCPDCGVENCTETHRTFHQQLMEAESLQAMWDMVRAEESNTLMRALTTEETTALVARVKEIYVPETDDPEIYEMLIETFELLGGEFDPQISTLDNYYNQTVTWGTAGNATTIPAATFTGACTLTLNGDVNMSGSITVNGSLTLDLNGYILNLNNSHAISLENGASLTINDSSPNTEHFGHLSSGVWKYSSTGSIKINGGIITGNTSGYYGAAIVVRDKSGCNITMNGGTIAGNSMKSGTTYGAAVYLSASNQTNNQNYNIFTMNGGQILYCKATLGGAVFLESGAKFIMNGGTIANNTAEEGGAVYVSYGSNACPNIVEISGGTISGNKATANSGGGGICMSDKKHNEFTSNANTMTVTGGKIENNTSGGNANNITQELGTTVVYSGCVGSGVEVDEVSSYTEIYRISYDLQGGTVNGANPAEYTSGSETFSLINPEKNGYTFTGWTGTGLTSATQTVTIAKNSTGNRRYNANWSPISYQITYVLNGGTGVNNSTYTVETGTFTLPEPTRTGYTFTGWTGSNGTTPQKNVSVPMGTTGDLSYSANWQVNQYTYRIVYQSGTKELGTDTVTYNFGTTNTIEPKAFSGYLAPASQTIAWDSDTPKTVTFSYAPISYTVTYHANTDTGNMAPTTFTYDTAGKLAANTFEKTGYTFAGWDTQPDLTGNRHPDQAEVTNWTTVHNENIDLYAVWTANAYKVSFDANGGTGTMSEEDHTYDAAQNLTSNSFTRTGYTFAGWATSASGNVVYADHASVKNLTSTNGATVILYAQWTANPYTYTFVFKSDAKEVAKESYTFDFDTTHSITPPDVPGYTKPSSKDVKWDLAENQTIDFGGYLPITYSSSVDLNGGTGNTDVSYNVEQGGTLTDPARDGWQFTGWLVTEDSGSWKKNEIIQPGSSIPAGKYGELKLQAQWEQLFGDLTISVAQMDDHLQSFVLTLTGTNANTRHISITVALTPGTKVTIPHLPYGTYQITNDVKWSWRYQSAGTMEVLLDGNQKSVEADYSEKLSNNAWLNGYGKGGSK